MTNLAALDRLFIEPGPEGEHEGPEAPTKRPVEPDPKLARTNERIRRIMTANPPGSPQGPPEAVTLADDVPDPPDWLEARLERAAILETEAGLPRKEVEAEAARLHPEPVPAAGVEDMGSGDLADEQLCGFAPDELLALAEPDERPALEADPSALDAYAFALYLKDIRAQGERPEHYTRAVYCATCGPVWLFPGHRSRVVGCPWCDNTAKGRPIPRPAVACSDCRHWRPDSVNPPGGLGSCRIGAPASECPGALWPTGKIWCDDWRPKTE